MTASVEEMVTDCPVCNEYQHSQPKETLRLRKTPELPWSEVATDLFEYEGEHYLVLTDMFSRFIEVDHLPDQSTQACIAALKAQMCRHGLADVVISDCGPQFTSREFAAFCGELNIRHETSSPHFPQSNGAAEQAVQTVKRLWRKAPDRQLALLDYRTTPLESCGL